MASPIVRTERLTRSFGSLMAVAQVDFEVERGELRSIIGPNGAGKTTFFRLISGEMEPSAGRIWFDGREITGMPQHRVSRLGVSKSYQITNVFPHLNVLENVRVAAQTYRLSFNFWGRAAALTAIRDKAGGILKEVGLWDKREQLAAFLSHGEKRHLELGIALSTDPTLLLLDEPTAGMSPEETDETIHLIRRIANGRTVILVEHKMKVVMNISDRITVLHQGQVLAEGSPAEIRANPRVQQTYLGRQQVSLLALEDLQTYYGEAHILQGVSLTVAAGEVVTLIGRNGAGKTTTLRSIMGLVPPRGGRITFDGRELTRRPTHEVARAGIAYVPEERRILPNLTVAENLRLGMLGARGTAPDDHGAAMEEVLTYFPRLRERYEQKGKSLSGGEQQMLAIARGLVARPKLMLVDEPTEGLSPILVENLTEILGQINRRGTTILLVEQILEVALTLSHRLYVMDQGRIQFEGTPDALRADPEIQQRFLGV